MQLWPVLFGGSGDSSTTHPVPCCLLLQGATCYCNFCKPIPHLQFGRLGLPGFLSVLIIGLAVLGTIAFVIMRANKLTVLHIPFAELHVSDESEVLGEGVHGKVLRGEYRGTQVAVKRMLPPRSSRYHRFLRSVCLYTCLCVCLSVCLSVSLAGRPASQLAACLLICLLMCPPVCLLEEKWGQ